MIPVITILSLVALSGPAAAQSSLELFSAPSQAAQPGVGLDATALRSRLVNVNLDLLRDGQAPQVQMNLFDDVQLVADFNYLQPAYADGVVWMGSLQGYPDSRVMFSMIDDMVSAFISFDDQAYSLTSAGNNVFWIHQVDRSAGPECGTDASFGVHLPTEVTPPSASRGSITEIDVMVVYTTPAKNLMGGATSTNSKINLAMAKTNAAFADSGVNQEVRLVHTEEMVGYNEPSSFNQMLQDLQRNNDGKMDNVHSLRTQYGADCVSLLCMNSQYCGLAYLMTNVSASFRSWAFSVVNYSCMQNSQTLAHELGHNFGSNHDPQNASSGAYSYSFGFRTSNNQYRTIMAYWPGTEIDRWSGPNVSYNGYTMGNSSQDNVRSLNNTASTAASWKPTVGGNGPVLQVPTLTAGQLATFTLTDCAPNGSAFIYYSTTGSGPYMTSYGMADLSPPLKLLPTVYQNSNGVGTITVRVPSRGAGVTAWLQGLDLTSGLWTDNVQTTVL
ncbi:MAG: M12 family metallo-peptidase [Planctomycetota bacterium]|jgi:hypothetical protein|nr:M12 family metallo-peptidase [Planctomycetota bacterium]